VKPPVIRLIDLGYDDKFGKSMSFAETLLGSINVSGLRAEVEFIRTQDMPIVARSLAVPARLIHIMGHGISDPDDPAFGSGGEDEDGNEVEGPSLSLRYLADYLQSEGEGIEATAVFADCCGSAQQRFKTALRDSLETEVVYIGATRMVDWHECTTFGSILYGSLLRRKGKGFEVQKWVLDSANMSIEAYSKAVDGSCPFKATVLKPSRSAQLAFRNARRGRGLA
jgi:hypothetical protein